MHVIIEEKKTEIVFDQELGVSIMEGKDDQVSVDVTPKKPRSRRVAK